MVAADSGLHTYVTRLATSSVIANRFKSEDGRTVLKNSVSNSAKGLPPLSCLANSSTPAERVGPGNTAFTVTGGAGTRFGKAARNGKLGGLRHAVMDHLGGGMDRALAADEHDASPVPRLHAGQIRTAQAYAAEHVDLEEPPPFLVGNIPKRLWLEYAEVVHENVHDRESLEQRLCRRRGGEVAREAFDPGRRHRLINVRLRLRNRVLRTTVHDDSCAFASEPGGDGKSNTFGGARDEGGLVREL